MKTVLLLYPDMLFYKIPIFNKLSVFLEKEGYKLIIWYRKINDPNRECNFLYIDQPDMTLENYKKVIREYEVDFVMNILFKRDPGYTFYFASILHARIKRIPVIFYGHGIDKQKDQWWRNILYNLTYLLFDGIILYTPGEIPKLWKCFHSKITCANNTLDIENIAVNSDKEQIKAYYKITSRNIILTTGRLQGRKKIEILRDIFLQGYENSPDVGWVIVGSDLSDDIRDSIINVKNIYYLGPIYEKSKMAEIFSISDCYCVPGALGLGIVEAIYWGLPVLTLNVNHGPEAYYLKNGYNAYIARNELELGQYLQEILSDDNKRKLFSDNAKRVFQEEATLDKMFNGFLQQLKRF